MDILALILLGTLTGNELAVGAFVHPALTSLPDELHAAGVQSLARRYGKAGPPWYAATLIALTIAAWRKKAGDPGKPAQAASAALMLASLVFTILRLVPINSRVASWDLAMLPPDWKTDRALWDHRHAVRIGILLSSLAALAFGTTRK